MKNAVNFLPHCLPTVLAAAEAGGGEVVLVDNGSSDGTLEWVARNLNGRARVLEAPGVRISALRNLGAGATSAPVLVFIDADCEVPENYLARVQAALDVTKADAVGIPLRPARRAALGRGRLASAARSAGGWSGALLARRQPRRSPRGIRRGRRIR